VGSRLGTPRAWPLNLEQYQPPAHPPRRGLARLRFRAEAAAVTLDPARGQPTVAFAGVGYGQVVGG
jgi:hypothetical protein